MEKKGRRKKMADGKKGHRKKQQTEKRLKETIPKLFYNLHAIL